jgi:phage terminase small subunit
MPNPHRKPRRLKALAGTLRTTRDRPEFQPRALADLPPAPAWLQNVDAVDAWDRVGDVLVASRVLTAADLDVLGHLCTLHGRLLELYRSGAEVQASLFAQYRLLADAFGLMPTSRSRVQPAGDPLEANPFLALDAEFGVSPGATTRTRRKPRTDKNKGA